MLTKARAKTSLKNCLRCVSFKKKSIIYLYIYIYLFFFFFCSGYDSYLMYLYGVVLKELGHRRQAMEVLSWALHLAPHNWAAWAELADLITKRRMVRLVLLKNMFFIILFFILKNMFFIILFFI